MSKRIKFLLGIGVVAALVVGYQVAAFASHPEVSLPGSLFEIDTNANLKVDDLAPSIDWVERRPEGPARRTLHQVQGTTRSAKAPRRTHPFRRWWVEHPAEQERPAQLRRPPRDNYVYRRPLPEPVLAQGAGPNRHDQHGLRVQPVPTISANGVTPVRTAADVLIQYDLANGGQTQSCSSPAGSPRAQAHFVKRPTLRRAGAIGLT